MSTAVTSPATGIWISSLLLVLIQSCSVVIAAPVTSSRVSSKMLVGETGRSLMDDFTISELLHLIDYQELAEEDNKPITLESIYTWGDAMSKVRGQEFVRSEARDFFNQIDTNKDGEISLAEWKEDTERLPLSVLLKIFEFSNVDTDDDGKVTRSEFDQWTRDYGKVIGDGDIEPDMLNTFELKDMNQDGVIEKTEWSVADD